MEDEDINDKINRLQEAGMKKRSRKISCKKEQRRGVGYISDKG